MATLNFIRPLDQPPGTRRLLDEIKAALADARFSEFRLIVAYAKSGPLHRLRRLLEDWHAAGKRSEAILGIDQRGTSREALDLALALFDAVYVTQEAGITFHPKIYLFKGAAHARVFVGSNNLTVHGMETNFEAAVQIDLALPADASTLAAVDGAWNDLLPNCCPSTTLLAAALLAQFVADGRVIDEHAMSKAPGPTGSPGPAAPQAQKSGLVVKPPSPLPKGALASTGASPAQGQTTAAPAAAQAATTPAQITPATAQGLAIQIKPHHNGEIFLSVTAALQNPQFFNWPFTGTTTPKKPGNPSYPQLDPDPIVDITVYGQRTTPLLTLSAYHLNTVYYERNSEIRITAAPLVGVVPDYSVMILQRAGPQGIDYQITIHTPGSPDYQAWLASCNQTMPSGGQQPRKFGWF